MATWNTENVFADSRIVTWDLYLMIVWQNVRAEMVFTAEKELHNTMPLELCPDFWSVCIACML